MTRADIKTFVLLCLLALLPLLFVAYQSLNSNELSSTLDLSLNSSSNWTQLRLEGATILGLEDLDSPTQIKHSDNAILMEGPGKTKIRAIVRIDHNPVTFFLTKDLMGQASAEINGIGKIENLRQPITIPISLRTNSTQAKIGFNGLVIKKSNIINLRGAAYRPVITESSISLTNPLGNEVRLDLLVGASVFNETPYVFLEKGDKGIFQAQIGTYVYRDNNNGKRTIRNLPVTVEMTSNKAQINFDGAQISQGKITQIDSQDLQTSILGDNFIFLQYSHNGTAFRRANVQLDLSINQTPHLTISKNNAGFVGVRIENNSYFLSNSSKTDSYVSQSYPIVDFRGDQNPEKRISVPFSVETTSEWTDITLDGLDGTDIIVTKIEGNISQPVIANGKISIKKNSPEDRSPAMIEAILTAESQDDGSLRIEKGDNGYTRVSVGEMEIATYNNIGDIKGDPRNGMLFQLPDLPDTPTDSNVIYNPVASIFPVYAELSGQGLTIEDTQPKEIFLSVTSTEMPGQGLRFSLPMAEGVKTYVFIAMLILLMFSIVVLRPEARLGVSRTPFLDTLWKQQGELGKHLPLSSTLIIEALVALAVIPPLLIDAGATATLAARAVYLVLVAVLILRLMRIKKREDADAGDWYQARRETIGILLAAGAYFALFELLRSWQMLSPDVSRLLLLATAAIIGLLCVFLVHHNRRVYQEKLLGGVSNPGEKILGFAVRNLESLPILIIEALLAMAVIPPLLIDAGTTATLAALAVYLVLAAALIMRLMRFKKNENVDAEDWYQAKREAIGILLAAGAYFGLFEFLRNRLILSPDVLRPLLVATAAIIGLLCIFLVHHNRRVYQEKLWGFLSNQESMPILIFEALVAMMIVPLLLIDAGTTATMVTLIVYLMLAAALILRLIKIKKREDVGARDLHQAKRETIGILLAAGAYFALFEFLRSWLILSPDALRLLLLATAAVIGLLCIFLVHHNRRIYREKLWRFAVSNLESMPVSSIIILEALISLAITPFLLLRNEELANGAAILAYLLLVAGVMIRFGEMKSLLNMDKQKEILIKILSLAVLPAAGIMGAREMQKVDPEVGQIFFIIMMITTAVFLAFVYLYLRMWDVNEEKASF